MNRPHPSERAFDFEPPLPARNPIASRNSIERSARCQWLVDVNASASTSSAANSGHTGDVTVNSGGAKQNMTTWIVLGVVAVIFLVAWLKRKK